MKIAIWSITRNGGNRAVEVSKAIGGTVFSLKKFNIAETLQFENLNVAVEENFNKYSFHIFIMATGIVVRTISKFIKGKDVDPAVILIDENITFAISLISGHIGGGNLFTKVICDKLNIIPIITTSSDITGKIAIDTLAEKLNCNMKSLEEAKNLTSLIVDNKNVGISLPKNVNVMESKNSPSPDGVVIISNREKIEITQLYPKDIILGVGCRRGVPTEIVLNAIKTALKKANISEKSIKHIATVDLKKDEIGIIQCSTILGVDLKIVSREEINNCPLSFKSSSFVLERVGVSAVSAPVAYLTSDKKGEFILEKFVQEGVTVSIYENSNSLREINNEY